MNHLSTEDIMNLAERTINEEPYTPMEKEQMQHLKECRTCYEDFCGALMVEDMFSPEGAALYAAYSGKRNAQKMADIMLATVKVAWAGVGSLEDIIMEQVEKEGAMLSFQPALADATRGTDSADDKSNHKLEDIRDAETFVLIDEKERAMMVQIKLEPLGCSEIDVSICTSAEEEVSVPLKYSSGVAKGIVTDIPDTDFEIRIRKKK